LSVFVQTGQFVTGTARETLAVDWVEKNGTLGVFHSLLTSPRDRRHPAAVAEKREAADVPIRARPETWPR
jgi:hypothetical protein